MTSVHAPTPSRLGVLNGRLAVSVTAAVASFAGARALGALLDVGPLALHMLQHMALLGVAAPITACALQNERVEVPGGRLAAAVVLQIALLWTWHLPPVFSAIGESDVLHVLMSGSLYTSGVWFWSAVYGTSARHRWQSAMALLLTGKLFCLFAAILVFSPRPLFTGSGAHLHHGHGDALADIDDQQLAGLIMITVCPLTYVAAGLVVVARWIAAMEREEQDWLRATTSVRPNLRSCAPFIIVPLSAILVGCEGVQSALSPASQEAESLYRLTVVLFVGGTAIFFLVLLALSVALFASERSRARVGDTRIVFLGGVVFPNNADGTPGIWPVASAGDGCAVAARARDRAAR
jgi:putative membrane protein